MELFQTGDILLSDFDGVVLDSQKRFNEVLSADQSIEKWMDFLNGINWRKFLQECEFIPGAVETLLELQRMGILKGFIPKIHNLTEGTEKAFILRDLGFHVPIYYVLPEQEKSSVYIPNRKVWLLDDKEKNCDNWLQNGGKSILYDPEEKSCGKTYVKSMYDLLK